MDDGLKQRLIGAFVLLALAVIFIPDFFERERVTPLDRRTQIPLPPDLQALQNIPLKTMPKMELVDEPKNAFIPKEVPKPELLTADKQPKETPKEKKTQSKTASASELVPAVKTKNEKTIPKAWVLQVASYRFRVHAEELRTKLQKDDISAYTRDVETDKGKMTRLYIGPNIDKERLEKMKPKLDKEYGINTILLPFEP